MSLNRISITSFEHLPTEILLDIFDYLSSNQIIYTFFYLNQRLQNLLLTYKRYITSLELPTNLNILPLIGSQIQALTINNDSLSFSLDLFSNLKSITICTSCISFDTQLQSILDHPYFPQLHSFKVKEKDSHTQLNYGIRLVNEEILFQKVFNNENQLELFEYMLMVSPSNSRKLHVYSINDKLRSVTIDLWQFDDIYTVLQCTPNLIYLNITTQPPVLDAKESHRNQNIKISLKQFYLKFSKYNIEPLQECYYRIDFDQIIRTIQIFSSSLITLSLNLIYLNMNYLDDLPFNGMKLENQLLKPIINLQNFYLYAGTYAKVNDVKKIVSAFQNQFWFDHNWTIGLHQATATYIYTLPFQFNELYDFKDFNQVLSNNDQVFYTHSCLWTNIISLRLAEINVHHFNNLFPLLNIKMPRLLRIRFSGIDNQFLFQEKNNAVFNTATTVCFHGGSMEKLKQCLLYAFPNVKNLILSDTDLPPVTSELISIFSKRIQRLQFDEYLDVRKLTDINSQYFLNLHEICLTFAYTRYTDEVQKRSDIIMKLLNTFRESKILSIFADVNGIAGELMYSFESIFQPILNRLDRYEIDTNYDIQRCGQYLKFIRICKL